MVHELGQDSTLFDKWRPALKSYIGHAIGLLHEFSRPDRLQYLTFQCQNLKDYEDVREEIETAPQNQGDTIEKA